MAVSNQTLINYYANLLILQYLGKPKAYAHIQTLVTPVVMNQLPISVQNAFNVIGSSPATGVQLDILGKYVGVTRNGYTSTGPISLSDSDFISLIQLAVITNSAGSSLSVIQLLLSQFFPNEIFVYDYQNMRMSYLINSTVGSQNLAKLFVSEGVLPKPMGVQLATTVYAPIINTFFGFRTYDGATPNVSPFNTYTSYVTTWPWLNYSNGLSS